ncbi:AdoMet dependent proline di-methyltransferase-domain-containing protein [Haematococcus lacustris]
MPPFDMLTAAALLSLVSLVTATDESGFIHNDGEYHQSFTTSDEAWQKLLKEPGASSWYAHSTNFWAQQDPSYSGVLLGMERLHDIDIHDSRQFLLSMWQRLGRPSSQLQAGNHLVALDCGAGVGRVTKELLLPLFTEVDLLEPVASLLSKAREELGLPGQQHRASRFYQHGLQGWLPEPGRYTVVWVQWCLLYLTDEDLHDTLKALGSGLTHEGVMFVKENVADTGFVVNEQDHSFTRSQALFEAAFQMANYQVVGHRVQTGFPEDLYEVHMWALRPLPSADAPWGPDTTGLQRSHVDL